MASEIILSGRQYWNAVSRNAFAGAKMYTYTSASRTINLTTYSNAAESASHTNPIIADANGIFPQIFATANVYLDIYSSDDATLVYQADGVAPIPASTLNTGTIVDTRAALKALDTGVYTKAFMQGQSAIDDGYQARYYFDSGSAATDDGVNVIAPDVGTGRWLILQADTPAIKSQAVTQSKLGWFPLSVVDGLKCSNGTDADHDIDIAVGSCADTTQAHVMTLGSALVKQIDAPWADNTGTGGCSNAADSGVVQANAWYGVFLLSKEASPTTCNAIFAKTKANSLADTNAIDAGYDISRLIWCVLTDASANIIPTIDNGNGGALFVDVIQTSGVTYSSAGDEVTVSAPPSMIVELMYEINNTSTTPASGLLTSISQTNENPAVRRDLSVDSDGSVGARNAIHKCLKVSSTSTIRHRETQSATPAINVFGWKMDFTVTDLV